ncbi:unnamed protein product [Rhodiola kirilowii]
MDKVVKMRKVVDVAPAHLMPRIKSSSIPSLDTIHEDDESPDYSATLELWKPFMLLSPLSISVCSLILQMLRTHGLIYESCLLNVEWILLDTSPSLVYSPF